VSGKENVKSRELAKPEIAPRGREAEIPCLELLTSLTDWQTL
jgi:hypothetical protein